jgi:hypothetical protein
MTLGDVQAIIALTITVVLALCSATVLTSLLAAAKLETTTAAMTAMPLKFLMRGVVLGIVAFISANLFHSATFAFGKLIFGLILIVLSAFALYGSAALATLIANRIKHNDGGPASFLDLYKAALVCLGASLAPLIGWFFIAPIVLMTSLGAGTMLIWPADRKVSAVKPVIVAQETQLS